MEIFLRAQRHESADLKPDALKLKCATEAYREQRGLCLEPRHRNQRRLAKADEEFIAGRIFPAIARGEGKILADIAEGNFQTVLSAAF